MDFLSPIYIDGDTSITNLNLAAGTNTTPPIKFTSGTNLTTPSTGAVEYDGTDLYFTPASSRRAIAYRDTVINVPVRQTVLSGSVNTSTGAANFLSIGTGLAVNLAATTTNITLAFAAGFDAYGDVNYVGRITSDVTGAFSGLTANTTSYLYVNRNTSTGALTYGAVTVQPVYQTYAPTNVNNLHWFDISEMQMKVGNGTTWTVVQRVFVGQAVTNASTVTSVVTYALRGQYDSGVITVAANTGYQREHNIGVAPMRVSTYLRYNSSYWWQDSATFVSGTSYYGSHTAVTTVSVHIGFQAFIGYGNTTGYPNFNNALAFPTGSATTGEARIVLNRGW